MNLKKRIVASLAALALAAAAPAQSPKDSAKVAAPGKFPIVTAPVTLKVFIPSVGLIQDLKNNSSAIYLEKLTGVKIDWIETSKVDAKNKLSIMMASGDYPDIIMGMSASGLSVQDIPKYGNQGKFIALNSLIETQGFYVKELLAAEPWVKAAITSGNGKIYGLPAVFTDDYHMTMRQKMWINKTWLDKLGLKMPTTADELYAVLKAFKLRDPNGNGKADEIPLTGAKRSQEDMVSWLMCAFIPSGGPDDSADATLNNYEFIVNGKVSFSADKPEFKEGLKYVARLYREGLIDIAGLTQDKDQIKPLILGETVRVGAVASHHPANFSALSDDMYTPMHQYAVLPPLKGPRGTRSTPWIIDQVVQPGQFVITDKCKNPVVAFRWADFMFSLDFALKERGDEGLHWAKVDASDASTGLNGKPALYQYMKPLAKEDNAQINLGPGWTRNLKNEFATTPGVFNYEEFLYKATLRYEAAKIARFPYATAAIADKDSAEFNDLRRNIHAFVGESTDRFIIGDLDIDKEWGDYVKQLDRIGLPRFMELLQKAYGSSSK
jgi:putative aldouronate transport system substrate-binding protein